MLIHKGEEEHMFTFSISQNFLPKLLKKLLLKDVDDHLTEVLIISKHIKHMSQGYSGVLAIISRPISHTWLSRLEKLKYLSYQLTFNSLELTLVLKMDM